MYANHNDLPAFISQIPIKESLWVSWTLGVTISVDNYSTARSNQSITSKMIIDVSRTKGITDKKLLVHHFGHFHNHIRNGWCNEVAIGFGKCAGDELADSLPCFAPHLRISGDLDNIYG